MIGENDSEDSDTPPSTKSTNWKVYYSIQNLHNPKDSIQSHESKPIATAKSLSNPFLEISYRHKQKYHTLKLPPNDAISRLASTEGLLPENTWQNLLNDAERSHLMQFLPQINGWKGLNEEAATSENLGALFRGENFDFGNPISRISASIANGRQTKAHLVNKSLEQAQVEIKSIQNLKRPVEALIKQIKAQDPNAARSIENQSSPQDVRQFPWKKRRILSESPVTLVTEENSLFLAIQSVLSTSPAKMSYDDLISKLSTSHARALPKNEDLFAYLDAGRYIKSALTFLQNPLRDLEELKQKNTVIWTQQFLRINKDSQTYEWVSEQPSAQEKSCLMSLEQYFRIPIAENYEFYGAERAAVQRMRREISRLYRPIAERKLQERHPQAFERTNVSTSKILRSDLIPRHPNEIWNLKDFHRQELDRVLSPRTPFTYKHNRTGTTHTVGPSLTSRGSMDSKMLVFGAPMSVSLLGLVHEAIARLPEGKGSRADIMKFVRHSQFLRPNVSNVDLNHAVVEMLDTFVDMSPPIVMYDAEHGMWTYQPPLDDHRMQPSKPPSALETPLKTENVPAASLQNLLH